MLEKNHNILNSILKESSFTKASDLSTLKKDVDSAAIPITKGNSGEIIANAYVTPDRVSIVLSDEIELDVNTPPLKSFFLERIIAEMKRKDAVDVTRGKIQPESVIDYVINKNGSQIREIIVKNYRQKVINKNGSQIREIIVKNYRQKERVNEIINTASWSLLRMLDKTK